MTFIVGLQVLNYSVAKLVHGHRRRRYVPQGTVRTMRSAESASQVSKSDVETNCLEWNADLDDILFNCCSDYPIEGLETIKTMARELQEQKQQKQPELNESTSAPRSINDGCTDDGCNVDRNVDCSGEGDSLKREEDETKLMRTSINTAIAIGLHNFPEGLATFVAALHDPRVGAMLAIAIAIHNIPEGLCVALPIYYATGKCWKAFGLAVCSGLSEPAAALLGWAILANSMNNTTYGILFGLVGGMMVTISVRELLPTAHRYDPEDSVVTSSYIFGMCIMALSLVIFVL
jgi:zinc transporter ZupT